jgi:hypothetical protein
MRKEKRRKDEGGKEISCRKGDKKRSERKVKEGEEDSAYG